MPLAFERARIGPARPESPCERCVASESVWTALRLIADALIAPQRDVLIVGAREGLVTARGWMRAPMGSGGRMRDGGCSVQTDRPTRLG